MSVILLGTGFDHALASFLIGNQCTGEEIGCRLRFSR